MSTKGWEKWTSTDAINSSQPVMSKNQREGISSLCMLSWSGLSGEETYVSKHLEWGGKVEKVDQCADTTLRGRAECLGMGALSQDTHLEMLLDNGGWLRVYPNNSQWPWLCHPASLCTGQQDYLWGLSGPVHMGKNQLLSLGEEAGAVSWKKHFGVWTHLTSQHTPGSSEVTAHQGLSQEMMSYQ